MKRGWQKAVLLGIAAVGMGALAPCWALRCFSC